MGGEASWEGGKGEESKIEVFVGREVGKGGEIDGGGNDGCEYAEID